MQVVKPLLHHSIGFIKHLLPILLKPLKVYVHQFFLIVVRLVKAFIHHYSTVWLRFVVVSIQQFFPIWLLAAGITLLTEINIRPKLKHTHYTYTQEQRLDFLKFTSGRPTNTAWFFPYKKQDALSLYTDFRYPPVYYKVVTDSGKISIGYNHLGILPLWADPKIFWLAVDNTLSYSLLGERFRKMYKIYPRDNMMWFYRSLHVLHNVVWSPIYFLEILIGRPFFREMMFNYPLLTLIILTFFYTLVTFLGYDKMRQQ